MIITIILLAIIAVIAVTVASVAFRKQSAAAADNVRLVEQLHHANSEVEHLQSDIEKSRQEHTEREAEYRRREAENESREADYKRREADYERRLAESAEREADRQALLKQSEDRFKSLAVEVLEMTSKKFKEQNESRLSEILTPLRSDIEKFNKSVKDTYDSEARERFSLEKSLKEMMDINRTIGREAKELTEALRGNSKVQGDWGETALVTILEKSGLREGVHFDVQLTKDEAGNAIHDEKGKGLRPDVVVNYPDKRCIVIDSKVSLKAYVNMANAESDEDARHYGSLHIVSVRNHIKELAEKNYQDYIGDRRADFVMMFIPNESAYMAAMRTEPGLWQEAYDKRVLIISPTHLISVVRLVEMLWRQDDIKRNAVEISNEAGKMYDKFVSFLEDMAKIDRSIDSARASYDTAINKLSTGKGNLVRRAKQIRELGAKTSKNIPVSLSEKSEIDDDGIMAIAESND